MPNLSTHASLLIGREKEIAEIHFLLEDPQCQLLTLVGPGGIGKTRLATEVITHLNGYADGVFFVPLQPVTSADLLVPAIATATGLSLAGTDPLHIQLLRMLRQKQLMLLLDNFEHLLAGAELLVDLLRDAPGVKLLVTSRERIGVREEWLYPVHGLTVPAPSAEGDPATYGALHLFNTRARQVQYDFCWENEREAVISICRQVEGNPLAVELAASWLAVLPCATIAARLEQGPDILTSPLRNFVERHRSMRTVFDHSWQLLGQRERDIFSRLSVFRGGFTFAAAQAVSGASLADLSALVFKSFIRTKSGGRYQIHELLRQYGAEHLADSPAEAAAAYSAYSDYFLGFAGERRPLFDGPHQLRVVQEIDEEYDNLYSALRWSVGHLQTEKQAQALRRALPTLTTYYQIRGRYLEGAETLEYIIHQLELYKHIELWGGPLAEALSCFGWLAIRLGRFGEAKQSLTRAVQLYDELHVPHPQFRSGHPRMVFLFLALVLGEFEHAAVLGRELCRQAKQDNQPAALALASYGLANAALAQGDYEQAGRYAADALTLAEQLGTQFVRTHIHDTLGQVAQSQGDLQAAKRHFEAALSICEVFQAYGGMAIHLKNLGDIAVRQKLWTEAQMLYEQSLDRYRTLGDLGGVVAVERELAIIMSHLDDLDGARRHFRQALVLAVGTRSMRSILSILTGTGRFLFEYETAAHKRALGKQMLRLVTQHPACDRATYEEAMACLTSTDQSSIDLPSVDQPLSGESDEMLEMLISSLQAELVVGAERVLSASTTPAPSHKLVEPLSSRELEVLQLLVEGQSNTEIARRLVVAVGTVKAHTSAIYRKLDVTNRTQAAARVHELGILN